MAKRDYYEVLGVGKNATDDELKKAFRTISKKYHPDMQHGKSDAEKAEAAEKFKEAAEAYDVLSSKDKRQKYDQFGFEGPNGFGGQDVDLGEFFRRHKSFFHGFFGGDPFAGFGPGFGDPREPETPDFSAPRDGRDIRIKLPVTFEESVYGARKEFDINVDEMCEACGSSGAKDAKISVCPHCNGQGMITQRRGMMVMSQTCPYCRGSGQAVSEPCPICGGAGHARHIKHVKLDVPAGAVTGQPIVVEGCGEKGINGGKTGILAAFVEVAPNELFRREGQLDIASTFYVSPFVAATGGKVKAYTVYGEVDVNIPAGVKDGSVVRLRGRGVKAGGETGDMLLEIKLDVPEGLSAEQRRKIEEASAAMKDSNFKNVQETDRKFREYVRKSKAYFAR